MRWWVLLIFTMNATAGWAAPGLAGDLRGRMAIAGAPEVEWGLGLQGTSGTLDVRADGLAVRVAVEWAGGRVEWRIEDGTVELGTWWSAAKARVGGEALANWSATGRLILSGAGAWADGAVSGRVVARLEGGAFFNDTDGVELAGVSAEVALEDFETFSLAPGQWVEVTNVTAGEMVAEDVRLEFGLAAGEVLQVTKGTLRVFGGRVALDPFTVKLAEPALELAAALEEIALSEVARLVPTALRAAEGLLNGRVRIAWNSETGFQPAAGRLAIVKRDAAQIRLAAQPGFLTGWLDQHAGFAGKVLRRNYYQTLRGIEMGETTLNVDVLRIDLRPDGAGGVRSAKIFIDAHPSDRRKVERVTFTINVSGALAKVIRMGLDERVGVSFQ